MRPRGEWLPYMPSPGGMNLLPFVMMSSDLRDSYLYTAGVVLAYAGGFADRAASFPDQSSIAYAGRPGDRAAVFVLLLYSALCR